MRATTTREVNENVRAGTNVGAPVAATDIGNRGTPENLTYELSGTVGNTTDFDSFDIDQRTGQIKVKRGITLDYEDSNNTDHQYTVTVMATDPSGETDTVTVHIMVVDVDETPELTLGTIVEVPGDLNSGFTHSEPVVANDREMGDATGSLSIPFVGDDPETAQDNENSTLTWTLAGTDADDFNIPNGVLAFKSGPDFEAPTDSGRNNVYEVTVQAADAAGNTASEKVKITVENVGEAGEITLSHTQPEVGVRLTASLADPDKARSIKWQWYRGSYSPESTLPSERCADANANNLTDNCFIYRATSPSYTPDGGDDGDTEDLNRSLTVVASYSDGEGSEKVALATTENAVRAEPGDNVAPEFQDANDNEISRDTREVREDADAENPVGDPVTVTETSTDTATADISFAYSLSSGDVRYFTINTINQDGTITHDGQIRVGAGTELDYETKKSYRVTVKAVDPSGASDTIAVTINVTDVDETPTLTRKGLVAVGRGSISYPENDRNTVAEYSALGPNAGSVSWRLTGPDASDFSMNSRGALTFRSTPNFEAPADSDRDNTYELTITARSGREQDEFDVTVDVYNVDEEGEVTLSPTRGDIGARITATLTDPDGAPTRVSWEWARSEDGMTGWTPVPGTNSDRYTLDSDDRGFYLQATARYTDPEGGGKSASARTTAAVQEDDDGRVTLSQMQPAIGDTVTATLTDPDGRITNTTWEWARSSDGESGWVDISGATRGAYTVVAADVGNYLRASANYDDGDGTGKSAEGATSMAVVEDDDGSVTLSSSQPVDGDSITASLSDPDGGVTNVSWQWAISADGSTSWTNISRATSQTYTPVTADVGSYLRATASYTDSAGPGKSADAVSSASVGADDDGEVTLSSSQPVEGETVSATLTDPDGDVTGTTWQWETSSNGSTGWTNIPGATFETYTPVAADVGRFIRATASYTDAVGTGKGAESASSASVSADDDGVVTISPSQPVVGEMVTANLTDPDNGVTGLAWQWQMSPNGSTGWIDRLGATSQIYTPVAADVGFYLRATAAYTDSVSPSKGAESLPSSPIIADDDGVVTLSASQPEHGAVITATLTDPDSGIAGINWQWARSADGQTGWTDINGATSATYTPVVANVGSYLRATASYTDSVGPDKSARAVTSVPVRIDDDGTVTLSWEELTVGEGVTASLTDLDNGVMNVEWQWARSANGSANWTDIVGATSETYTPVVGDVNSYLRAAASYDDAAGIGKSARAVTSAAVKADDDGTVTLSTSEPEGGAVVTATLSDPDEGVTNVSWQWAKSDDGSTGWTDIQGATSASYRPVYLKSDEGVYLRATANYDDAVGIQVG